MPPSSSPESLDSNESDCIVLKRIDAAKQGALAAAVGLDPSTLSNFVNGKGAILERPQLVWDEH